MEIEDHANVIIQECGKNPTDYTIIMIYQKDNEETTNHESNGGFVHGTGKNYLFLLNTGSGHVKHFDALIPIENAQLTTEHIFDKVDHDEPRDNKVVDLTDN